MSNIKETDYWRTPQDLFNVLNEEFEFQWDLACTFEDCLCRDGYFYDKGEDALEHPWHELEGWLWLNPPYSAGNIGAFMDKVLVENCEGASIVTLTRMDPSTQWWEDNVHGVADEVRMLSRRPQFILPDHPQSGKGYNFPCAVSVFDGTEAFGYTDYTLWDWK